MNHSRNSGGISPIGRPTSGCEASPGSLPDRAHRAASGIVVLRCQEGMETCNVAQRTRRPDYPRHGSVMGGGRVHVLAGFEPSQPGVSLVTSNVVTGCLVFGPGGEGILPYLLATFLALDV